MLRIVEMGTEVMVVPAESFVDYVLAAAGYDPLDRGLQILDAHRLPDPLVIDKPTIIAQLDTPEALAETAALVSGCVPEGSEVLMVTDSGCASTAAVVVCTLLLRSWSIDTLASATRLWLPIGRLAIHAKLTVVLSPGARFTVTLPERPIAAVTRN